MVSEGYDYIICKICGEKVKRLYGAHLKKHNITSDEYKDKYPGELLTTIKDSKNTSKNSGLHMKQEKYKKIFSDKIKGDKNPNHKSKTTNKERKERSPFSKEFVKYNTDEELIKFRERALKDRKHTTHINYYLEQGYDEEESKILLKERQSTFSKEICIQKYGEKKGLQIYTNRQEKWQNTLNKNGNMKQGYSKISQNLFYLILDEYKIEDREYLFFATKNNELRLPKKNGGIWIYDFCDRKRKKIIEYNGDEYHANPKIFEANDYPHPFRRGITAKEIWDKDVEKLRVAKEEGYDVLVIWDRDYRKNKKKILDRCIKFLNI